MVQFWRHARGTQHEVGIGVGKDDNVTRIKVGRFDTWHAGQPATVYHNCPELDTTDPVELRPAEGWQNLPDSALPPLEA